MRCDGERSLLVMHGIIVQGGGVSSRVSCVVAASRGLRHPMACRAGVWSCTHMSVGVVSGICSSGARWGQTGDRAVCTLSRAPAMYASEGGTGTMP